jgi:glycosyltransferase involved in cell wall biosynthesis
MGGAEVFTHEVAKRWVEAGHEVTLFTSEFPNCERQEVLDGIGVIRSGGKYSVYWKAERCYKNRFSKENYDVVVEGINTIPFFAPIYVSEPKLSLIFQLTGEVFSKVFPKPIAASARYIEPQVYKILYRKMAALVLSSSVKDELVKIGFMPGGVHVAEPGVDFEYYRPGVKTEYPSVLYFNRVAPYKNVDHLIKAFKIVKRRVPRAKLYIVGCRGTKYELDLRRFATRLNLVDSIEFDDFVQGGIKKRFLQMAWVHVLPSTKEGWGISVVEAAASGTPTAAYDVIGLRDSVKNMETGLLVPFNDVSALADAMTKILIDEGLRSRMSRRARGWAERFSWERTANRALSAVDHAIGYYN